MSVTPFFARKARRSYTYDYDPPTSPLSHETWDLDPLESFSYGTVIPLSAAGQMDWKETRDAHIIIADVPGVRKDELKIEVEEEKVLKISGQRTREGEEKNDKWHRVERYADKFERTVRLPPNTSLDGTKAVLENGVLTLTVPKAQQKKGQGRFIPIKG